MAQGIKFCHTFKLLHVARVKKHTAMRESHAFRSLNRTTCKKSLAKFGKSFPQARKYLFSFGAANLNKILLSRSQFLAKLQGWILSNFLQ